MPTTATTTITTDATNTKVRRDNLASTTIAALGMWVALIYQVLVPTTSLLTVSVTAFFAVGFAVAALDALRTRQSR